MVEEVEELETDAQRGILPARNFGLFHDSEIGVEITRSTKPISALRARHRRTVTDARGPENTSIEAGLASGLEKKCVRAGRNPIRQRLGRQAGMRRMGNGRPFATRRRGSNRPDWHGIEKREIVLFDEIGRGKYVQNCVGQSSAGKKGPRYLPTVQ